MYFDCCHGSKQAKNTSLQDVRINKKEIHFQAHSSLKQSSVTCTLRHTIQSCFNQSTVYLLDTPKYAPANYGMTCHKMTQERSLHVSKKIQQFRNETDLYRFSSLHDGVACLLCYSY